MVRGRSRPGAAYWLVVAVLLTVGAVSILTIGYGLLLIGVTLVVLSPFVGRPRVFWPGLVVVLVFIVGFLLIAPWGCTTTSFPEPGKSSFTVCRSLIGVTYTGPGVYNPSLVPGLLAGAALGLISAVGTWWAISRRQGRDDHRHEPDNLT